MSKPEDSGRLVGLARIDEPGVIVCVSRGAAVSGAAEEKYPHSLVSPALTKPRIQVNWTSGNCGVLSG